MKKYNVQNEVWNAAQIKGEESTYFNVKDNWVGDYIEAGNEEEAIAIAIDYLAEKIQADYSGEYSDDDWDVIVTDDDITICKFGEKIERYCNFVAKEIEEYTEEDI